MKKFKITNRRNQAVKLKVGGGYVDLAAGAEVVRWLSEEQAALAAGAAKIEVAELEEPKAEPAKATPPPKVAAPAKKKAEKDDEEK